MQKYRTYIPAIIIVSVLIVSCTRDAEEELAPACTTDNMRYSTDILPIIQANCYSCHAESIATAGVILEGYDHVKARADNGDLTGVITHAAGYTPMPNNSAKLSDCDINKIKSWVENGAPDN